MENPLKIIDTFANLETKNIFRGNELRKWDKIIITEILKYYSSKSSDNNLDPNTKNTTKFLNKLLLSEDIGFEDLLKEISCTSTECLIGYALLAYQNYDNELLIRTINTFGRVSPLDKKTEWYDNFRLNAYGNIYNIIMWEEFDNDDSITIKRKKLPINTEIDINFDICKKYLIGVFRSFLITHDLLPVGIIKDKYKEKNYSDKEICDIAYKYFPFYYLGAHGCNALIEGSWTANIKDISNFLDRYPSAICGGIFNTSAYGSQGQHWMTTVFYNTEKGKKAVLICSQASPWTIFQVSEQLLKELQSHNFALENNNRTIQKDDNSCGLYSALSLFAMICKNCNLSDAIDMIGINAENFGSAKNKEVDIYTIKEKVTGWK